jgi:hypothetical protein
MPGEEFPEVFQAAFFSEIPELRLETLLRSNSVLKIAFNYFNGLLRHVPS